MPDPPSARSLRRHRRRPRPRRRRGASMPTSRSRTQASIRRTSRLPPAAASPGPIAGPRFTPPRLLTAGWTAVAWAQARASPWSSAAPGPTATRRPQTACTALTIPASPAEAGRSWSQPKWWPLERPTPPRRTRSLPPRFRAIRNPASAAATEHAADSFPAWSSCPRARHEKFRQATVRASKQRLYGERRIVERCHAGRERVAWNVVRNSHVRTGVIDVEPSAVVGVQRDRVLARHEDHDFTRAQPDRRAIRRTQLHRDPHDHQPVSNQRGPCIVEVHKIAGSEHSRPRESLDHRLDRGSVGAVIDEVAAVGRVVTAEATIRVFVPAEYLLQLLLGSIHPVMEHHLPERADLAGQVVPCRRSRAAGLSGIYQVAGSWDPNSQSSMLLVVPHSASKAR